MKRGLILVVCFLVMLPFVYSVDISSCQGLQTANTIYRLTQNVSSNDTCFAFGGGGAPKDNVTLDCQGYTVSGGEMDANNRGASTDLERNITVKNCIFQYFDVGVSLGGNSDNSTVLNNTILHTHKGIYANGNTNGTYLTSNRINNATHYGILLDPDSNQLVGHWVILNNTVNNTNFGVSLSLPNSSTIAGGPTNFTVEGNIVENTRSTKAVFVAGFSNRVTSNRIYNSTGWGLELPGGSSNITNNTIYGHVLDGIVSPGSANNYTNNVVNRSRNGFYINFTNNLFSGNTVSGNNQHGFYFNPTSSGNVNGNNLTGNTVSSNLVSGIRVNTTSNAITVRDVRIYSNTFLNHTQGTAAAIDFLNISGPNHIYSNLVVENNTYGVYATNTNSTTINSNNITRAASGGYTVYLSFSNSTIISLNNLSASYYGVNFDNAGNNTLSFNNITSNNGQGVIISVNSSNNTLNSNTITNNTVGGISISANHNLISGNTINSNANDGISIEGYNNNNLTSNIIFSNHQAGINLLPAAFDNRIYSNTIYNHTTSGGLPARPAGIYTQSISNSNQIYNNLGINNNTYGIYLYESNALNITNNTINSNNNTGIYLQDSNSTTLTSNSLNGNGFYGIALTNGRDNNLFSNTIFNNSQAGVYLNGTLSWSTNNRIYSNTIHNHSLGLASGIYFNGLNVLNHIYSNLAIENNTNGVYLNSSNLTNVSSNTLRSNTYGIRLVNSYNSNLISNTLLSNGLSSGAGISFSGSNNTNISSNTFTSNYNGFELISNSGNNTFVSNLINSSIFSGVECDSSINNTFSSNNLSLNAWGIDLLACDNSFLNSNRIHSNSNSGVNLGGANNNLTLNTIFNNSGAGIQITSSSSANNRIYSNTIYNHTNGSNVLAAGIYLDLIAFNAVGLNQIYNNPTIENNTYGIYSTRTNSSNFTNNTFNFNTNGIYLDNSNSTTINSNSIRHSLSNGVYFLNSYSNNLSLNNLTNNTLVQYFFNGSNATFINTSYVNTIPNSATVLNITNNGFVAALSGTTYNTLITDHLNFSFANATNLSFLTSNNASASGVGVGNCSNALNCLLASNVLVMNNLSSTANVQNLTIYYNSSLLNSTFNESNLSVGRYNSSGWTSLGTAEVNTVLSFVRLASSITSFSPFGAVAFTGTITTTTTTTATTSSSSSSGGGGPGGTSSRASNTQTATTTLLNIPSGQETTTTTTLADGTVVRISFRTNDAVRNGRVRVTRFDSVSDVPEEDQQMLQAVLDESLEIEGTRDLIFEVDLEGDLDDLLGNITNQTLNSSLEIEFIISLEQLGINSTDELDDVEIVAYQVHDDGSRERLQTRYEARSDNTLVVTITVTSNSYFIIVAESKNKPLVENPVVEEKNIIEESPEVIKTVSKAKFIPFLIAILVFFLIGIGSFYYIKKTNS